MRVMVLLKTLLIRRLPFQKLVKRSAQNPLRTIVILRVKRQLLDMRLMQVVIKVIIYI